MYFLTSYVLLPLLPLPLLPSYDIFSGRLTLISGTDPRTMATMHSLHAHWRRLDGEDDDEDNDDEEEDDEDEDGEGSDDRVSEFSGGGVLALTPRTTTSSSSHNHINHNQHRRPSTRQRLRPSEVCEVAGLNALATGNSFQSLPPSLSLGPSPPLSCTHTCMVSPLPPPPPRISTPPLLLIHRIPSSHPSNLHQQVMWRHSF